MKIEILEELEEEFQKFCKINELEDINKEAYSCFISGFNIKKIRTNPHWTKGGSRKSNRGRKNY